MNTKMLTIGQPFVTTSLFDELVCSCICYGKSCGRKKCTDVVHNQSHLAKGRTLTTEITQLQKFRAAFPRARRSTMLMVALNSDFGKNEAQVSHLSGIQDAMNIWQSARLKYEFQNFIKISRMNVRGNSVQSP